MVESIPRIWRERKYKYRLIGSKCSDCGKIFYPPRTVCLKCGSRNLVEVALARTGRVFSYTVIRSPPSEFTLYKPYIVALIELDDGARILSQLTDVEPEDVKIGMRVKAVFRRYKEQSESGVIEYGIKFTPLK